MPNTEFGPLYLSRPPSCDSLPLSSPRELSSEGSITPRSISDGNSSKRQFDKTFCRLLKSSNHQELQTFLNGFSEADKLQFLNSNLSGKINTSLTLAASEGNAAFVKCLINNGADVDYPRQNGDTPLTIIAKKGHISIAKILINAGADMAKKGADVNKTEPHGNSPLYFAAICDNPEMVNFFLEKGADTSIANIQGYTPLAIAVKKGHITIAKSIIQHSRADINKADNFGETPLISAIRLDQKDLFRDFLNHKNINLDWPDSHGFTPIIWAISKGDSDLVDMLIFCGSNPGHVDKNGDTPLIFASKFHNIKITKMLCDQNIDLSHKNHRGQSALSIAKNNKDDELADFLTQIQKNTRPEQYQGWEVLEVNPVLLTPPAQQDVTPRSCNVPVPANLNEFFTPRSLNIRECNLRLILAILSDRPQFVSELLDKGAQINNINDFGQSPACVAAEFGRIKILEILINHYPDAVNQKDGNGNTPIILAASHDKREVVNFLIKNGADPLLQNNAGKDAFDTAMVKGYGEVVKELMGPKTSLMPNIIQNLVSQMLGCSTSR